MNGNLHGRLRLAYAGFRLEAELDVPLRGVIGVFGPSGSGKTTLLRCVAGLERPHDSLLTVDGVCWLDSVRRYFLPPHRRPVAVVFQEARLFPHLTVHANLNYGRQRKNPGAGTAEVARIVEMLGIEHLLQRKPGRLSGGEQQRVAIGRALLTQPKLLLMDEPLASLDLQRKAEIMPFLERLHAELEIPVFYVSHSLDELTRLADYLVLMSAGRIKASGPLAEVLTRLDLPLAEYDQAAAIITGVVAEIDAAYRLALVRTPAGALTIEDHDYQTGQSLRLRIHARDVSLSRVHPQKSSILNSLPVRVAEIGDVAHSHVNVRLEAGGVGLLSRVSRRSRDRLGLHPGMSLYAQIKGIAIEG